jgi:hypothetical protein
VAHLEAAVRRFLRAHAPQLQETVKWGLPFFVGSGHRNAVYIDARHDKVILGFNDGAEMVEFHGLFDRVLKQVAQVDVRRPEDLERPGLADALRAAAEMACTQR